MGLKKFFNRLVNGHPDKLDDNGETALFRAAREGNISEVKKQLARGADPNVRNGHGLAPLHVAAYWGELGIVDALLAAKADVNADTGKGWTPLHSAALAGGLKTRARVIERLRRAGAREDIRDKNGMVAADYMTVWRQDAVAAEKLRQLMEVQSARRPDGPCAKCGQIHKFCGPSAPKHNLG